MISRNDLCWCGSGKKWKKCHFPMESQDKGKNGDLKTQYYKKYGIIIKSEEQIQGIRQSCQLTAQILEKTAKKAVAGVTTEYLDAYAAELCKEAGAIPAALNYGEPPFPKGICTSLNEVICHGIPGPRVLVDGDILNIDVTCIYNGYYGDCSVMVVIGGKTTPERQLVVDVAYECLMRSINILRPGIAVCDIGTVIEDYARSKGCSVVNQFVAHGVGVGFHENPQVPHCYNNNKTVLVPGMTFTIEPMINAGVREAVINPYDQWTASTRDGKGSAQWEHTILITETGHEVLTTWTR